MQPTPHKPPTPRREYYQAVDELSAEEETRIMQMSA